jgi:hypothetical protein
VSEQLEAQPVAEMLNTMTGLVRASKSCRIIVAGSHAFEMYLCLLNRGFLRAATPSTCRPACARHDIALVAGHRSSRSLETLIARAVAFLEARAALVVLIEAGAGHDGRGLHTTLKHFGFRVRPGMSCPGGYIFSAHRRPVANAA